MNFVEHVAKEKLLRPAGIPVPQGFLARSPEEAADAFGKIGPCVVKAQVPTGKRGKAGGIKLANDAEEARSAAEAIIGMTIGDHRVESVLIEEQARIDREFYAAILPEPVTRSLLVMFSPEGGMDIEEIAAERPHALHRASIRPGESLTEQAAAELVASIGDPAVERQVAKILVAMLEAARKADAELLEINPLALLGDGRVVALDAKLTIDDSSVPRQPDLAANGAAEPMTELERRGAEAGLKFIQLDGNVGVLANGAGLTMTTMDVISHFGGRPANFLEIGGEAYTKAEAALDLVLSNPGVRSLVVNFCGAFARTDVMAEGVIKAWEALKPDVPVFFSIHGTGEDEAVALVRERLRIEPYDLMEDAVKAAVEAAQ